MKQLLQHSDRILVGGHRGCACSYPENSIKAMAEGIRRGADYLEIDIQLTSDEVAVVYHDVRLEQKTELNGYVHEFTYSELRERIPGLCTFQEAMEWGCQQEAYFALELKSVPLDMQEINKKLVSTMIPIIKKSGMWGQVLLFGADHQVLSYAKKVDTAIQTGLIVPYVPCSPVELMKRMDAVLYLSYVYNMTPGIIRSLKENGYYVSGAILREEKWMRRAVELGVTMFESDMPFEAKKYIKTVMGE